ncbi:hypothetical protein [Flavobacterium oreochromis]|uniref:Uncharacterized protein n=1 Tax=Flavobacterium columnare TaxID=996 RepID=A0A246G7M8_9FLAO|nr:hypothetical protein [Flavobacterium oreochromis]OWP74548.1 hypothetical protein BWK62_13980 [Flavobacterium oreochromis]POR26111.1 hypothetical protein BWK58_05590 [Flavobacterium columnare]
MKTITYKDYIKGIKEKYEIEKKGAFSGYLSKPSPALLNDYCKILKQNGLSKKDQEVLELFYGLPNFDNDKFRPVCNFFNGKTVNPSQDILDIMAVLVDFKPRPLGDFLKNGSLSSYREEHSTVLALKNSKQKIVDKAEEISLFRNLFYKKKSIIILLAAILPISIASLVYLFSIQNNSCLIWKEKKYIEVSCDTEANSFTDLNFKIPYDENLLHLRKIEPTDTTTYFKNGKAIIWYCKINDKHIEIFNAPGHHPVSNKPLKAITRYIINKYLKLNNSRNRNK